VVLLCAVDFAASREVAGRCERQSRAWGRGR
jgi:hypothetical protein